MSAITGATRLAAVIGSPVRHSLSPALHNAAFAASGADWRCVAFEVPVGEARAALAAMRSLGIGGFAVTMPHKADMADAVDEVDAAAADLRSVNTVVLRPDGSTFGASTDGAGLVASVREAGVDLGDIRAVVLGAGAAARSIVRALDRAGARSVAVVNRTRSAAELLVPLGGSIVVADAGAVADATLLVNATSVGMGGDELPLDPSLLRADLTVVDIVYHPLETALVRAARSVGAPVVDGLGMLVHQAVLQQELWTGRRPDPVVMRAAAEAELGARSV
ncbi:MAG TPA: shikimate dehydrogenase [Ilumatobacter sp.]